MFCFVATWPTAGAGHGGPHCNAGRGRTRWQMGGQLPANQLQGDQLRRSSADVGFSRGPRRCPCAASSPTAPAAAEFEYKLATGQDPTHPVNIARAGGAEPHPRSHRRQARHQAVPGQPAGLRHRPARAGAQRQRRVLQPVDLDPVHVRAGRRHPQHRLRLQGLRRSVEGDGRRPRHLCPRADRQDADHDGVAGLGQRLPPDHLLDARDQDAGRPEGLQDPRARRRRC